MKYLGLGKRLRSIREHRDLSVEQLSKKTGIPAEKLEKYESDEETPLIATLISLSKALEVNVADIFRDRPQRKQFTIVRQKDRQRVRPLLEKPVQPRIFDYAYEMLIPASDDKHLDAYMVEFPSHQSKRPKDDVTHEGEEFIFVLQGQIEGEIGGEKISLKEGDSLYFRSNATHVFFNPGATTARAIVVIYPF